MIAAGHEEPGCELHAIHACRTETIVTIEKWTSAAGPTITLLGMPLGAERIAGRAAASRLEATRPVPLPAGTEDQGQL